MCKHESLLFKKRNVKGIALSGDSIKDHLEWIPHINKFKDTLKPDGNLLEMINNWKEDTNVNYPIIADEDFSISTLYGMYHPRAKPNSNSLGTINKENIRAVYIIDSNKTIKTILIYPKNIGRNFKEILRTIDHAIEGQNGDDNFNFNKIYDLFKENGGLTCMINRHEDKITESADADLMVFGIPFIANPDFVFRLEHNLPLNEACNPLFFGSKKT